MDNRKNYRIVRRGFMQYMPQRMYYSAFHNTRWQDMRYDACLTLRGAYRFIQKDYMPNEPNVVWKGEV